MQIVQLLPGLLIGIATLIFLPLFVIVIILGIYGLVNKNYTQFKKWGKFLLYDVLTIIVVTTIWGLLQILIKAK